MTRRLVLALSSVALVTTMGAGIVVAGEITGNGKLLTMHARSECAFSGQEDLQWFYDDGDTMPKPEGTKGDPAHAQSWGQIPKAIRDELAAIGLHPGMACNPIKSGGAGEP